MYKAILFDLDGTLTRAISEFTKSVQYALEKIGKPEPDREKLRVFVGPPLLEQFMKYADLDEETARQAVTFYRERYSVTGIFENRPYEGIKELLEALENRGYILAVASSKPEYFVEKILDYFDMSRYFKVVVGSEMNGGRTKKADVIQEALKRLHMENHREQVIMVGDKEHDVFGAKQAGVSCVAVSYGYGTMDELVNAEPLQIVNSPAQLLDFFC